MQISRLQNYLEGEKNYLITNESDVKYLLWNAYFKNVEILVKNRVIFILADTLNMWTISQAIWWDFDVLYSRKPEVMNSLFNWISELIVNPENISMARETRIMWLGVEYVWWNWPILTEMRNIKQEDEIELLRESQRINYETFENIKKKIKLWMSEEEIALMIKMEHLRLWASWESFEPIVAFSENWANPHHINWTEKKLKENDQILIDMWCVYKKYCSDMTRVVFMRNTPTEQEVIYQIVKSVANECKNYWKIWMTFWELNDKAKDLLWMYKDKFNHTLSHWVGVDMHEVPLWPPWFERKIEEWMVFTIEPGLYFPWKYWFRYEIMVVATSEWLLELN